MSKFIRKSLILFVILIGMLFTFILYYTNSSSKLNKYVAENSIYIWGDSQAKAGFDLKTLKSISGKDIYSSAQGGAGVYDFLVFAEMVPDNSCVILSFSQLSLLRERDKSNSGLPLKSIPNLIRNNYPYLLSIIRQNIIPRKLFETKSELYPIKDSLTKHEPLSKFIEIYSGQKPHLKTKRDLYIYGVKYLIKKGCKIIFVEFPFHPSLVEIMNESDIAGESEKLIKEITSLFQYPIIDSLYIGSGKRYMYDLSHLNETGAKTVSTSILIHSSTCVSGKAKYFVINGGICE